MNFKSHLKNFTFRVGAQIIALAKQDAPFKTGNLKKDIQVISHDQTSVTIGNTALAPYAKFVHFGTKPHLIRAKNARALAAPMPKIKGLKGANSGQKFAIFGKEAHHPGTRANPYLSNAAKNYLQSPDFAKAKADLRAQIASQIFSQITKKFSK